MKRMTRIKVGLTTAAVMSVVLVGNAFALPGDAPTFDANTLKGPINDFGTAMLAGLVILLGVVWIVKTPFALVQVANKAVAKLFGRAKPSA